jgi:hypothetical protein
MLSGNELGAFSQAAIFCSVARTLPALLNGRPHALTAHQDQLIKQELLCRNELAVNVFLLLLIPLGPV